MARKATGPRGGSCLKWRHWSWMEPHTITKLRNEITLNRMSHLIASIRVLGVRVSQYCTNVFPNKKAQSLSEKSYRIKQLTDELVKHRDLEIAFHQNLIAIHNESIKKHTLKVAALMKRQANDGTRYSVRLNDASEWLECIEIGFLLMLLTSFIRTDSIHILKPVICFSTNLLIHLFYCLIIICNLNHL